MVCRVLTSLVLSVCVALSSSAQNDALLSHYFEAPSFYNPAATGLGDKIKIRAGSRLQWTGIENAPKTFIGLADTPFKIGKYRFGAGVSILQESFGLYSTVNAGLLLSYKIKLAGGVLSLGIRPGMISEKFNGSEVFIPDDNDFHEADDDAIPRIDISGTSFDIAMGAWYTRRAFYAGVSVSHLNCPTITMSSDNSAGSIGEEGLKEYEFGQNRTLYLIAGGNIAIKNTLFEVMPSAMFMSDFTISRVLATARLRYKQFLSAGVGYRQEDAVSLLLGVEFKGFYLSYCYDYSTSAIAKASNGSHEIFAGYSVKLDLSDKNKHKQKSIRIM